MANIINMTNLFHEISRSLFVAIITSVFIKGSWALLKAIRHFVNGKDAKAYKYTILSPINNYIFNIDEIKIYFWFLIDVAEIYLVLLILWVLAHITQKAINQSNGSAYILLAVCLFTLILSGIASNIKTVKRIYFYLCCCIIWLLLGCCIDFSIMLYFPQDNYNHTYIMLLTLIGCLYKWEWIECIYTYTRYSHLSVYKKNEIIRGIRNAGIVLYFIFIFWKEIVGSDYQLNKWVYNIFALLWVLLCMLEDFYFIDNPSNETMVKVTIYLRDNCDKIQSGIYQYECNKVRYVLDDSHIKIIDSNEILSIDYALKHCYVRKKRRVTCLLKNGDILEFDGYKFIRGSWVYFYKISENAKHVKIINNMRIREILSKN